MTWTGEASTSSGIILISTSLLMFLVSANILNIAEGILPFSSHLVCLERKSTDFLVLTIQQFLRHFTSDDGEDESSEYDSSNYYEAGVGLPLSVVLPLTIIPTLVWLIVKYVSLRLHLGRN